jgi:tetratricopeptide (TPR) repeat protein
VAQREREDKSDSCIRCHMPQLASSDIAHAAITDHRIPRSPDQPPRPDSGLGPTDLRLLSFFREQVHSPDPEYERDLGVALGTIPWQAPADKDSRRKAERALPLLDKAVRRAPGDVAAWEAKGVALVSLGRPAKALEALDKALEREPGRELTLSQAARVAEELDRGEAMLNYCRKLVAVNPWNAEGRGLLARAYFALEKWDQAQAAAKKTLELDPASCTARMVLVGCLLKRGEQREAEAEFDRIVALQPPNLDEMRRWYFARTR